jgi:dCMP deaminase
MLRRRKKRSKLTSKRTKGRSRRSAKKWDKRFWKLAKFVAEWSKDPKAKIGAVLTTKTGGAIALGYNGLPVGVEDSAERLTNTKIKLDMIIHAEQNALVIAGQNARGATLYVRSKPICARCAGLIIQAGVARVVALDPEKSDKTSKWRQTGMRAVEMLREAGVDVEFR